MKVIKRFVAGAVCPRCNEMDRLRTFRDEQHEYRECVDCGYEDRMRLDGAPEEAELPTRVNQPGDKPEPTPEEQVLQFRPNPVARK